MEYWNVHRPLVIRKVKCIVAGKLVALVKAHQGVGFVGVDFQVQPTYFVLRLSPTASVGLLP